jgi:hypothetical protein
MHFPSLTEIMAWSYTAASLLLRPGIHPKQVQDMLGHKDIRLTLNTYSHISPDMQNTIVLAMNQVLNRSQLRWLVPNFSAPGRIRTCDRRIRSARR